jgi:hypothetical protein
MPSARIRNKGGNNKNPATYFNTDFLFGLFFDPENGDDIFLGKVC